MFHTKINGTIVVFSENGTFKAHIDFRWTVPLIIDVTGVARDILSCKVGATHETHCSGLARNAQLLIHSSLFSSTQGIDMDDGLQPKSFISFMW